MVLVQASARRQVTCNMHARATVLTCADNSQQQVIRSRINLLDHSATDGQHDAGMTFRPDVLCWHDLQGYCCSQSGFCSKTPAACDGTCQVNLRLQMNGQNDGFLHDGCC